MPSVSEYLNTVEACWEKCFHKCSVVKEYHIVRGKFASPLSNCGQWLVKTLHHQILLNCWKYVILLCRILKSYLELFTL